MPPPRGEAAAAAAAADDDDDPELSSLLRSSLLDPCSEGKEEDATHAAARELGAVLSARLTERSLVRPTAQRVLAALRAAEAAGRARLLGLIGWDLFEALLPWARGGAEVAASATESSGSDGSSSDDPSGGREEGGGPVFELLDMALAAASGREALMMLQGALSSQPVPVDDEEGEEEEGGAYHPSAVPWMVGRMADALLRVEPARRGHFLEQTGRLWLAQVRAALQQPTPTPIEEDTEGGVGAAAGARRRLQQATAAVVAVLEGTRRVVEDAGAGRQQLGTAVGLLLALLRLRPPQPPTHPAAGAEGGKEGEAKGGGGGGGFPLSRTAAALLRRALTASPSGAVSVQAFLSYPLRHDDLLLLRRHKQRHKRRQQNSDSDDDDDDDDTAAAATERTAADADPCLPPFDSPLAWDPVGVALAASALLCCGGGGGGSGGEGGGGDNLLPPSLRALLLPPLPSNSTSSSLPLLPTPLAPAWAAQWLVAPHAALLLQKPDLAPLGLALLDSCLFRLLPPPPLDPLLTMPAGGAAAGAAAAGREGALRCVYEGERDVWAQTVRGLTGCIAFLSEEPLRQRAYRCLPPVVALLTHRSRFTTLATALPRAHNHVASALLVSLARKALAAAWAADDDGGGGGSPWRSAAVQQFYAPALAAAAGKRPEALVSMAGASGGPESEGELDQLMAALNFLRFLMLKDPREANVTGIWTPSTLQTTLTQLRALDSNVSKVLGSGCGGDGEAGKGTQASSFRLNMLAEVLSLVVPPLAEAVGEGMEVDG